MGQEIERKFLVTGDAWRSLGTGTLYRQGYIPTPDSRTVRVRLVGDQGYLTLKGPAVGIVRPEFEYPIPAADATEILETLCDLPLVEKVRHRIPQAGLLWEVDEFLGANQGLIVAEVELPDAAYELQLPEWVAAEVTADPRYLNVNLAKHPFSEWAL
ncbi:MAG: CYTH domain-containing protein [Cyanobacteria bacterium Co-bin8]|nr:CYTH domain-containing protein [Cyanobacteria bacterium Co-bin8]